MPEHTPAPTPDRAVYGYSLYLLFNSLFVVYMLWSFIPDSILRNYLGLTYLPDKYFALYTPILILCCITIFAFLIYPSLSLCMTPDIDDEETIRDKFTIYRCQFYDQKGKLCKSKVSSNFKKAWKIENFCESHKIRLFYSDEEGKSDFCDCFSSYCLLRKNPNYNKTLRSKVQIPAVYDLDIAHVCKEIFDK